MFSKMLRQVKPTKFTPQFTNRILLPFQQKSSPPPHSISARSISSQSTLHSQQQHQLFKQQQYFRKLTQSLSQLSSSSRSITKQRSIQLTTKRLMSTTSKQPQIPLKMDDTPIDHHPSLEKWSTKEAWKELLVKVWKYSKIALAAFCFYSILTTFGLRKFFGILLDSVYRHASDDIERHGSASMWYFPILCQHHSFALEFNPNYPSLNYYHLKIFVLKEMEAAHRSAQLISDISENLLLNCTLRKTLLQSVLQRGWAIPSELTQIIVNGKILTRQQTDDEIINQVEMMKSKQLQYEIDRGLNNDENIINNDKKLPIDSSLFSDRIELTRPQIAYIQSAIDEMENLSKICYRLQEISVQLSSSTCLTLYRLKFHSTEWDIPYDKLSSRFHELASMSAATGKLTDALYALTATNSEQILHFLKYFDKTLLLLNDPNQLQKNKYSTPTFPKLSFDVPTPQQYSAQLATLQSQYRSIHDPIYDANSPTAIYSDSGQLLNPSTITPTRPYIPYVSPARPFSLPSNRDFERLSTLHSIDPTFDQEVEYCQMLNERRYFDSFGGFINDAITSYRNDRDAQRIRQGREEEIRNEIKQLGKSV